MFIVVGVIVNAVQWKVLIFPVGEFVKCFQWSVRSFLWPLQTLVDALFLLCHALIVPLTAGIALFQLRANAATNALTSCWSSLIKRSPKIDFGTGRDYSGVREATMRWAEAQGRKRSLEPPVQRNPDIAGVLNDLPVDAWWWWWHDAFRKIK